MRKVLIVSAVAVGAAVAMLAGYAPMSEVQAFLGKRFGSTALL